MKKAVDVTQGSKAVRAIRIVLLLASIAILAGSVTIWLTTHPIFVFGRFITETWPWLTASVVCFFLSQLQVGKGVDSRTLAGDDTAPTPTSK